MLLCDKKARALEKGVPEKKAKVKKLFETNQLILGASFILFYPAGGHIPRSPSLLVSQCTPPLVGTSGNIRIWREPGYSTVLLPSFFH